VSLAIESVGVVAIFSLNFAVGSFLLGRTITACLLLAVSSLSGV